MRASDVVQGAADLVLGGRCAGCGRAGLGACAACVAGVLQTPPLQVRGLPDDLPPVFAGGAYDAELRSLLLAAKERDALGLLPLLGGRLAAAVATWALERGSAERIVLVPVPTASDRVVERGVDLTAALAAVAARRLRSAGLPVVACHGLRLVRRPLDQSELGRDGRLANVAGAFRAIPALREGRVVVVDDIVTTGGTLREATRACGAIGRAPEAAATVAATRRRAGGGRGGGAR